MAGQLAPKGGDIEDKQGFKRPARLRRGELGVEGGTERSHRLDLAQFCEGREHLAGDGRAVAPGVASEHRRDELTGAATIVAHTAGETIALERGVDSASVVGIEMTARRARWLVEGEARATIEGERHAAEANAARTVAAQGCVVGHGDLDRGCGRHHQRLRRSPSRVSRGRICRSRSFRWWVEKQKRRPLRNGVLYFDFVRDQMFLADLAATYSPKP